MNTEYIKLHHADPEHKNWFVVNWCLGNTCNYECSYCPAALHDGSKKWPELETIKNFILKVKEFVPNKKLYFEFTGGEVTVYKHFLELAQFCKDQKIKIGLISNGARTLRYWEENKHLFDHICLSFHPEHADPMHFIDVVRSVSDVVTTHVNIMMAPESFDECFAIASQVAKIPDISLALQPLIVDFGDTLYEYTEEQKEIFADQNSLFKIPRTRKHRSYRGSMKTINSDDIVEIKSAHQFIADHSNNWAGWKCWAGLEQLIVDMDGQVYRGWCKVGNAIGHISDPDFKFPTAPVLCDKTMCHCNFDIMCTKEIFKLFPDAK